MAGANARKTWPTLCFGEQIQSSTPDSALDVGEVANGGDGGGWTQEERLHAACIAPYTVAA